MVYTTLIHPSLEYCCAVWDPHLQKDIDKLKSVQRLACKICAKNWSASYDDHLHILNLPITPVRRRFLKLCTMYVSDPCNVNSLWVHKLTVHSVCSHYLFHELIRSKYFNSMEWPLHCYYIHPCLLFFSYVLHAITN